MEDAVVDELDDSDRLTVSFRNSIGSTLLIMVGYGELLDISIGKLCCVRYVMCDVCK